MRENTRCDVDEPISTPTLSTTISSSSTSERPVLEKNTRPPTASSVISINVPQSSGHSQLSCPAEAGHPVVTVLSMGAGRARFPCAVITGSSACADDDSQSGSGADEFRHHGALLVEV